MIDSALATAMHDAVEHSDHGVMKWLSQYW